MSGTPRPPIDLAHASWVDQGVHRFGDAGQADATWAPDTMPRWSMLASTTPPIPPITLTATLDYIQAGTMLGTIPLGASIPDITLAAVGNQDTALPDNEGPRVGALWSAMRRTTHAALTAWQDAERVRTPQAIREHPGQPTANRLSQPATDMLRLHRRTEAPHAHGLRIDRSLRYRSTQGLRVTRAPQLPHAHGIKTRRLVSLPFADTIKLRARLRSDQQDAVSAPIPLRLGQHQAQQTATPLWHPWAQMIHPAPGRWWPFYEPPSLHVVLPCPEGYVPRPLECTVLLHWEPIAQPYCPGLEPPTPGAIVIPALEVYHVINTFSLVRADNGQPVSVERFDATLDTDSWTWGWSARMHADLLGLVRSPNPGEYVELIATVNGTPLRIAVERLARDRQFGSAWLRVSGRGRAYLLGEPNSPAITRSNAESHTVQQLLDDVLTDNGVPIGWTVDWQAPVWTVPAGVWSHTGTFIGAATRLAEAAGAYVQAHDTAATLAVRRRYPILPWDWPDATPDLVLPENVCEIEGIEWLDRPAYNAVWVSGAESGRRDRILRTGSAADRYAPSIVDPLATHTDMTRARGAAVLADTGRQAHISVRLPVLQETGIIRPGTLVQYNEGGNAHRGLTRSVALDHQFPRLWQTIRIETHPEAA